LNSLPVDGRVLSGALKASFDLKAISFIAAVTHIYYRGNFRYRRVNASMAMPLFRAGVSHWILKWK
jgi:hypothetical protein